MLIDSHCHLEFPDFKDDIHQVFERARECKIEAMLTIATSISNFANVLKIAALKDNIYASVGIHPYNVEVEDQISAQQIVALCASPKIIGIGETGLDYHYPNTNKSMQLNSFIEHIKAAQITGLPLIIHTRDAGDDTIKIMTSEIRKNDYKAVIHCYTENMKFAEAALDLGFYISFSGIVTFKNAIDIQEIAKIVPLDRILVETDSPYLAPKPFRGKRNEPSYVAHTAKFISELKGMNYEEFCAITTDNFYKLFSRAKS